MKNRIFLLLLACGFMSLLATSCIDDKGNYLYEDADKILPVTISGVRDTSITINTVLRIVPDVQNADNDDYVYSWYVTPTVAGGSLPQKTVLSDERILDIPIKIDVGNYFLSYEVRDKNRDVYVRKQVNLTVTASNITTGWYVLKDINNETDFDYINEDGSIRQPDVLLNNAIPNGRMKGTAVQIAYQRQRYSHPVTDATGVVTILNNQQVLHILSSEDIRTFNARTLILFKNYEDQFYGLPENCRPQSINVPTGTGSNGDVYMLNDGKVYTLYGLSQNIGKYLGPKTGFYSMHKDVIAPYTASALLFDLESSSFYYATASGTGLTKLKEESESVSDPIGVSPNNMPYTLQNLLLRANLSTSATAYAVMKDKNQEEYYLAGINFQGYAAPAAYPFLSFKAIPAGCKMPAAEVKAAPYSGDFVYFAAGNELRVYKDAEGISVRESVLKTFPAGETISYIAHQNPTTDNWLVVLTNSAAGWKLYVYKVTGLGNPEINEEPVFTYSGTGNARHVMYR